MSDYGEDVLDRDEVLEGTWTYGGNTYDLEVNDISGRDMRLIQDYTDIAARVAAVDDDASEADIEQINEKAEGLDDFSWEDGDGETPYIQSIIDEKLVRPDVDVDNTGYSKLRAIFEGIMQTWQESKTVANAKDEMPLDEGNG